MTTCCFITVVTVVVVNVVGELLKRPVDLIDPNSDLATLYSLDDSRFPLSNSEYSSTETLFLLRQLGMATDSISWEVSVVEVLRNFRTMFANTVGDFHIKKTLATCIYVLDFSLCILK